LKELVFGGILLLAIITFSSTIEYSYSSLHLDWTFGAAMPTKRSEVSGVAFENNVYIIGGADEKGTTDLVEVYDIDSDSWSIASRLPEKRDHTGAAIHSGKIFVVGGFDENGKSTNSLFIYDTSTDKWKRGMDMPTARGALAAQFVNGTLYAIGGDATVLYDNRGLYNPQGVVTANEAYDPDTDSWTIKSPMPTARDHLSAATIDEKILVIGGRQPEIGPLFKDVNVNEMYDPLSDSWVSLKPLPTNRSGSAAASVDGNVYVFGGESTKRTFSNNEKYNPKTDLWSQEPSIPTPRHGLAAVVVDYKVYLIAGGPKPGGSGSDVNEIFHSR
jgi:N-acetylneuraminic acid mutarotase